MILITYFYGMLWPVDTGREFGLKYKAFMTGWNEAQR